MPLNHFARLIVPGLLLLCLAGCQSTSVPASAARQIKTVGIVSTLGPLYLEQVGAVALFSDNAVATVPINDWGLDRRIERYIADRLKSRFDVQVVSLEKNGTDLTAVPKGLDAYVIVYPGFIQEDSNPIVLFRKPYVYRGLGLARIQGSIIETQYGIHAPYLVVVKDGRKQDEIARQSGNGDSWRFVDEGWWPSNGATLTSDQKQKLQDAFTAMIDQTLPATIDKLKLDR
jgi:hypothetical protein